LVALWRTPLSTFQIKVALIAMKKIVTSLTEYGEKDGLLFVIDPTTGTLIVSPDQWPKINRTPRGAAYIFAFGLNLHLPSINFRHLAAKYRQPKLRATRYLSGQYLKAFTD
jgi:hypothetical protein